MTSPKYGPNALRCVSPPTLIRRSRIAPGVVPDRDLIMRTWRIDCGKATPEDLRKQRNHDIRQWIYRGIAILVFLYILYILTNIRS
jgi:hypothetical protein